MLSSVVLAFTCGQAKTLCKRSVDQCKRQTFYAFTNINVLVCTGPKILKFYLHLIIDFHRTELIRSSHSRRNS